MSPKVPIRIKEAQLKEDSRPPAVSVVEEALPPVVEGPEPRSSFPPSEEEMPSPVSEEEETDLWRDRALRLEAEMDNFRKRQRRLADDQIAAERERLLRSFLSVTDDLARALGAGDTDVPGIRQGVELTYQNMMRLLKREGVEEVAAEGEPFDPAWHEATGTVPCQAVGLEPDTVAQVVRSGYRLDGRLLRPAQVIVAVEE